ncbi:MAG: hypothetical protein ABJI96_11340 [Paracoccaceae bacterium]
MTTLARVFFSAIWFLAGAAALAAQPNALTLEQLRTRAGQALSNGDAALGIALAEGILVESPNDFQTLVLLSLAHLQLDQTEAAASAARRAYEAGTTSGEKLQAARIAASVRFNAGHHTRAEWWLRKGVNHAKTPEEEAIVEREFRAIRQRNPLSVRLGFSIAPSNNINGGATDRTFSLGDFEFVFNPSSLALSGIEYSGELELSYWLSQSPNHITQAGLYLYGRTYTLSSASQATVPNLSGSDFGQDQVEASLSHRQLLFDGLGPSGISLRTGQVRYGREPYWRYNKLTLSQNFPVGQIATATVLASVEDQTSLINIYPDTTVYELRGNYAQGLPNQDILRLSLLSRYNKAAFETNTFTEQGAALSYELAKPVLGSRLSVSFGIGMKNYDEFSLSLDGRRDRYVSLGATAVFEQISYFGFSPSWSIFATKTKSNVTRFSTEEITARLGLRSNF